jgi:hypothetical protein
MHILLKDILSEAITDNPNFNKWFKNSIVVDNNGLPLKVYHGTAANKAFDIFNTSLRGAWFAANSSEAVGYVKGYKRSYATGSEKEYIKKHGRVFPVYLSIQNPKIYSDIDLENLINSSVIYNKSYKSEFKKLVSDLRTEGYDGIVYESSNGDKSKNIYVAFKPTQIKSIYNNGDFDPNNPDISK